MIIINYENCDIYDDDDDDYEDVGIDDNDNFKVKKVILRLIMKYNFIYFYIYFFRNEYNLTIVGRGVQRPKRECEDAAQIIIDAECDSRFVNYKIIQISNLPKIYIF